MVEGGGGGSGVVHLKLKADPERKKLGFVFVNFDCITRIYFDFGQHNKPQTQEFYRAGTAPPGFEIPGSAPAPHF